MLPYRRHRLTLALLTACVAPTAFAQETDTATTLDSVVVVAERAVTATKTDTSLVETPQAVSVVTSDLFTQRGAQNLQETLRYSAGVTAEAYGMDVRGENFFVRGLSPVEYLDGMRKLFNFNYAPIPRMDVYTLDRVEVLRGPSSALYGAGTAGGVINAMSKRPQMKPAAEIGVQFGSFDRLQVQADVTGALDDEGDVSARFVGLKRDSGMQTDWVSDDRLVLAPSMSWRLGNRTQLTLLATYQRDESAGSQQFLPVAATLHAAPGRRLDPSTFLGDKQHDKLDATQQTGTLLLEHGFSDELTWRSSLRYADVDTDFRNLYPDVFSNPADPFIDADKRLLNRYSYDIRAHQGTFTSDNSLQYNFDTGPLSHQVLAGIDYSDFRQQSAISTCYNWDPALLAEAGCVVPPVDAYNPVSDGAVVAAPYVEQPDHHSFQVGVFVQDQVRVADRVSFVYGLRRDKARNYTEGLPTKTDYETTQRIGVIGEVGTGVSPYLSYSESFVPVPGLDIYGNSYVPMRGRQVEAGVKWVPARGAMFTGSVYRIIETNRMVNDPENVLNAIQTGEVRSRGVELEGAYAFGSDWLVTAAYSYNEAEVTKSSFAPEIGVQLSDTPKRLASAWVTKGFTLGDALKLRVGLGGRHVGPTLSTTYNGSLETPGYTLADALLSLEWADWSLSVNTTNLFDKQYFAPCRGFGDCFTGNGRAVIGTVTYRF